MFWFKKRKVKQDVTESLAHLQAFELWANRYLAKHGWEIKKISGMQVYTHSKLVKTIDFFDAEDERIIQSYNWIPFTKALMLQLKDDALTPLIDLKESV